MSERIVGEEGRFTNFTRATRAMNTPPDRNHIAQYDEYDAKRNPLQFVAIGVSLVLLALAVYWFITGHWVLGILGLLGAAFAGLLGRSFGKATVNKSIAYQNGLLIPGVIVSTNPIEVVAMADMSAAEDVPSRYGCVKFTAKALPNHIIREDEQVPCVALFGMATGGYRSYFQPRPVAWGWNSADVIAEAIEAISYSAENPEADDSNDPDEWGLLQVLAPKMKGETEYGEVRFFEVEPDEDEESTGA